jgi:CubicO group peptidase (beta-lactamase class C family)
MNRRTLRPNAGGLQLMPNVPRERASVDSNRQRLSCAARLARVAAHCGILCLAVPASAGSNVELRIEHIQRLIPPVLVQGEARPKLSDRMAKLHVPGVSIAVIHDGAIQWARGFGVTRVGGTPVTAKTLFQAASISKPVTALAVLRLVQAGKLDLDTDVNRYLKTWKVPANRFTEEHPVTLRELLTHTAGITVHGFPGYASDAAVPTLTQVLDGTPPANSPTIRVDTTPGTAWRYSGGGYVIVQQLLEDVTGTPFAKLMRQSVLVPLGMTESTFDQPLAPSRTADVALPYRSSGRPVRGGPHVYPERAPAGLWTTPSDLARYALEVQRALAGSGRILSTATASQMLTPEMNHWGLGPMIGGSPTRPYFEHSGGNEGYRCILRVYETGDGAVVMTNGDDGGALMSELMRTIAYEYAWPDRPPVRRIGKVDPKRFDTFVGTYQMASHGTFTFTREGKRLLAQATGQGQVELFPESERVYFAKVVDAVITFQLDDQGRPSGVILRQNGQEFAGKRLDDAAAKPIAETLAIVNKSYREQKPLPGSEATLRKLLEDLDAGTPDYTRMSPELAADIRANLAAIQKELSGFGPISELVFKRVHPDGAAIYRVTGKQAAGDAGIRLGTDGTIDNAFFQKEDD